MEDEWLQIYADVEDLLFPQLKVDPWERVVYYHLLRHTRLKRLTSGVFSIASLAKSLSISDFKIREVLRALHAKSCLKIEDRSRNGHLIHVFLPAEIGGVHRLTTEAPVIDVTTLDFFSNRTYIAALLARQNRTCFYCLRALTNETCELDHLIPQVEDYNNSYRNIVASCHNCNKGKGSLQAADFIRQRYRANLLSEEEFQDRLAVLEAVQSGTLVPDVSVGKYRATG